MEIYERIRLLRKNHLHLSQEEFGAQLGVSRSVIKNIEANALRRPDQKEPIYKLICKEFGVSYIWLTQGIDPMFTQTDQLAMAQIDNIMVSENSTAKKVFKAFARLDDRDWETVEKIIKALLEDDSDL